MLCTTLIKFGRRKELLLSPINKFCFPCFPEIVEQFVIRNTDTVLQVNYYTTTLRNDLNNNAFKLGVQEKFPLQGKMKH